jgi:LmbE family N-acetylglucosaminyl deacetylase
MMRVPLGSGPDAGPTSSARQLSAIRRLRVVGRVLCVAAHPDDENTGLLSWLVHGERVRAAYLSLTTGEGGQNLMGPERAPLLGLIRTQELLAARRIDGAEQFFGGQVDFGYSKSTAETLSVWNAERALGEVVGVIRHFQPDVIITRFSPDERDTHGHHTASARLAIEAFTAAADPTRFPEQLETSAPWQATRVVWNWFTVGRTPAPPDAASFLAIDIGGYDPLVGESYPEIAARSLSMHKTQGFGSSGRRGSLTEYVRVLAGAPMRTSIFDGIDRTWARVPGGAAIDRLLARAEAEYVFDRPFASVPVLIETLAALDAMADHPWKADTRRLLCETIAGCAALHVSAHADAGQVTPGSRGTIAVEVIARSPLPVTIEAAHVRIANRSSSMLEAAVPLVDNQPATIRGEAAWPEALGEAGVDVDVTAAIGAATITLSRPVVHRWIDPVAGERWEPVTVVPTVTLNPDVPVLILPDARPRVLRVRVRASAGPAEGIVRAEPPADVTVEPAEQAFALPHAAAEQVLSFTIREGVCGTLRVSIDRLPARELVRLDYPHIPPITLTRDAQVKIVRFDLARAGHRVGYIPGAGDEMAPALRQAGYDVTLLFDDLIESADLSAFDAIVTGVRAFNTSQRLGALMPRLMHYVEGGGTLVVQYNTNTALAALTAALGPYPLTIGEDRVSEENAEVRICDPDHPVFTWPNRIVAADFAGWVQERGLCFSATWDRHYRALISTHDRGEPARNGGLLVAAHGAGRLVYTGLAFFRQLPAGVPGAFRLFANLLARDVRSAEPAGASARSDHT